MKLRSLDPRNETIRRLGGQVTDAIKAEAQARPDDPRLQAAVRTVTGPADAKPETEKVRDSALATQWITRGNRQLGGGRLGEARTSFERAVAADSGAHAALAGLAEVAYNESDFTRAVLTAKRAIMCGAASVFQGALAWLTDSSRR